MVHQVKPCLSTPSHCFAEDLVQCIKNGAAEAAASYHTWLDLALE